ncbi:MAG: UvrB/UvrC motif-containing protein, partial [Gammaproteobacteria bacterium]|nr:UvrB/UvrC motif-containing protein [Gammaproteobacteria bacterium]
APLPARQYAKVADEAAAYAAMSPEQMARRLKELEKQMYEHARNLEFEEAARVRDRIRELQGKGLVA